MALADLIILFPRISNLSISNRQQFCLLYSQFANFVNTYYKAQHFLLIINITTWKHIRKSKCETNRHQVGTQLILIKFHDCQIIINCKNNKVLVPAPWMCCLLHAKKSFSQNFRFSSKFFRHFKNAEKLNKKNYVFKYLFFPLISFVIKINKPYLKLISRFKN